jgi:hypothetical protein
VARSNTKNAISGRCAISRKNIASITQKSVPWSDAREEN